MVDCSTTVATLATREPVGGATGRPWLSVTGWEVQVCPLSKLTQNVGLAAAIPVGGFPTSCSAVAVARIPSWISVWLPKP